MASPGTASAAQDTCTWTGATDGDIDDATNWTGCDNGTLPEDGDDLDFPIGVTTYAINWNLPVTPRHITVDSSTYEFDGTQIILSGTLNAFSSATYNSTVIFQNNTGQTGLNVQSGTPVFNAGITFNVTGSGFVSIFTTSSILNLPAMSGTTPNLYIRGNPTAPVERYNLASGNTFTATNTYISDAEAICSSVDCFGNASNTVTVADAGVSTYSQLTIDTPAFGYGIIANNFGATDLGQRIRVMQDATLSGDFTATSLATVNIDSGATATFSGAINNNAIVDVHGSSSSSSQAVFTGDATGGSQIALTNVTGLFNGTNSNISSYVYLFADSVVGGTGTALAGIQSAVGNNTTLTPGTSPGCLSSGFYTDNALSEFVVEIAGTTACSGYDRLTLTGAATLNDVALSLNISGGPYAVGTVFNVIDADSVAGTFSGLADGATFTAGGHTLRVNYTADSVTLTVLAAPAVTTPESPELSETGQTNLITAAICAAIILVALAAGIKRSPKTEL